MIDEIADITLRSLAVSGAATLLSASWSMPIACLMSRSDRLSSILSPMMEAVSGVPTVLIGLVMYMLLSRGGLLGPLQLLYTPYAIILGQAILVTPLMVATSFRVLLHSYRRYGELAASLGATEFQKMGLVLSESIPGLIASVMISFSRAVGELGVALMLGGNIRGYTRVMSTAIALEVSRGEFEKALTLGAILLAIVMAIALSIRLSRRLRQAWP